MEICSVMQLQLKSLSDDWHGDHLLFIHYSRNGIYDGTILFAFGWFGASHNFDMETSSTSPYSQQEH